METVRNQLPATPTGDDPSDARERADARKAIERKRKFWGDVAAYVVINAFLVLLWATATDRGSFWPGWVMAGWGALLVLDGWQAFFRRPVTEADIDAELARRRGK